MSAICHTPHTDAGPGPASPTSAAVAGTPRRDYALLGHLHPPRLAARAWLDWMRAWQNSHSAHRSAVVAAVEHHLHCSQQHACDYVATSEHCHGLASMRGTIATPRSSPASWRSASTTCSPADNTSIIDLSHTPLTASHLHCQPQKELCCWGLLHHRPECHVQLAEVLLHTGPPYPSALCPSRWMAAVASMPRACSSKP